MKLSLRLVIHLSLSMAVVGFGLLVSDGFKSSEPLTRVGSAEARVGRPMTPMSYAGVARRTTRRGAVAGAAAAGGAYYASGCEQVVDAYGQIAWQCP